MVIEQIYTSQTWILERILGVEKQNDHVAFNHVGETIK